MPPDSIRYDLGRHFRSQVLAEMQDLVLQNTEV
jgi:hypothetical protein